MELLLGWIAFSILASWIASTKNRSAGAVLALSLVLSPLIGIIVALVIERRPTEAEQAALEANKISPATHVRCPDCKELVRRDAVVCKHCHAKLTPQPYEPVPIVDDGKMFRCSKCQSAVQYDATECPNCFRALIPMH